MQTLKMKLADMRKPEKNVRNHTERQLQEYERSVKMFGQIRPIVVDENNEIMIGVGLYDTLVRLGYDDADLKRLYESLMAGDPKLRNLRAIYQSVYTKYVNISKVEQKERDGNG